MKKSSQRKILLFIFIAMLSISLLIILKVCNNNIVFFLKPSEFHSRGSKIIDKSVRLGGAVKQGSVKYSSSDTSVTFVLVDAKDEVKVKYDGVLPSLFREGSEAVVQGKFNYTTNLFEAEEVLAKHDENYRPKERS